MNDFLLAVIGANWLSGLMVFLIFLYCIEPQEKITRKEAKEGLTFLIAGPILVGLVMGIRLLPRVFRNTGKFFSALKSG